MENMHQLEAAVRAAGLATAYLADEWAAESPAPAPATDANEGSLTQH